MSLITSLIGLFKAGSTDKVAAAAKEATSLVDKLFTSDDERKAFTLKMEQLQQLSQSAIARTARGSMVWSLSIILVYQSVIRDLLIGFGVAMPESAVDVTSLITKVMTLLSGV